MTPSKIFTALTLAILAGAAQGAAPAAPAAAATSGPLAPDFLVNGVAISQGQVEQLMKSLISTNDDKSKAAADLADRQRAARKELATQEALSQKAIELGLDKDPEVADQMAQARRELLSRAYIQNYFMEHPVSDAVLKAGYEWNRANGKIMEYKVRHILVPTSEEAQAIIDRLNKGEDFVELAKLTKDPGGNTRGGLLGKEGWFRPDIFVDPYFSDAVEGLKSGQYTQKPVRTRFGWHVIKVDEGSRKVANPEPFDKLHASSREALRQKTAQLKLNELATDAVTKSRLTDAEDKPLEHALFGLK
jgi:peptidyl-prolyl cis-trans isomerase C